FDEPDASTAVDAFQEERDLSRIVLPCAHESRLLRRLVPMRPFVANIGRHGQGFGVRRAPLVEGVEPRGVNRSCDAETAAATEDMRRAVPVGEPTLRLGVRTPAVKAVRGIG